MAMADKHRGMTRRAAAAGLLTAMPLAAQAPAAAPAPESMEAVREAQKRSTEQLRKLKVPVETEPAFSFHP